MRILVITDLYPPYFEGGYELNCEHTVEALLKRSHEIFVLTSWWGTERGTIERNVYRLLNYDSLLLGPHLAKESRDPWRLRRRCNQLRRAFVLRKNYGIARGVVASLGPDVAFIWNMEHVSIGPVMAVQDQHVPTVFRLEDYWLTRLRTELFQEANLFEKHYRETVIALGSFGRLNTNHLLVTSQALLQRHIQAGFPAQCLTVIPEGVPAGLLQSRHELSALPLPSASSEIRLLYAGRLAKEKGPDVAIQALSHLVREGSVSRVRLDLIGSGSEEYSAELKEMVRALGLESKVTFVGKMGHHELIERYKQYHVLLFTSRWVEPFGVTVLEVMARGLPVIATNCGGPAEIISDGDNGFLVPPNEPGMIASAVKRLVREPGLAQRIRHAALTNVREKYLLERVVDQLEGHLQAACGQFTGTGHNRAE